MAKTTKSKKSVKKTAPKKTTVKKTKSAKPATKKAAPAKKKTAAAKKPAGSAITNLLRNTLLGTAPAAEVKSAPRVNTPADRLDAKDFRPAHPFAAPQKPLFRAAGI